MREIKIEEMPQGCILTNKENGMFIIISSREDAESIIESLENMIKAHFPCEVSGCHNIADYEGWYRAFDGFGMPVGIQRRKVCESHKHVLIGND